MPIPIISLILIICFSTLNASVVNYDELPYPHKIEKSKSLNLEEARLSIGYPKDAAKNPDLIIRSKQPIVLIDSGFVGIEEFLKNNPDKRKNVLSYITFYEDGKKATSSHGFNVYKSALLDSPNSQFHLFQVDIKARNGLAKALKYMREKKLFQANYSAGIIDFLGDDRDAVPSLAKLLEKYQITLFMSAGNDRDNAHYFAYQDSNHDKKLEFIPTRTDDESKKFQKNWFYLKPNYKATIKLIWPPKDTSELKEKLKLQIVDKKGKILAHTTSVVGHELEIIYEPKIEQAVAVEIIDEGIINPTNKEFVLNFQNVQLYKNTFANGFGMFSIQTLRESPFIITVGSYGRSSDGTLSPSHFSSYTKSVDGKILPHILGPGQLHIDQKDLQGTSFSSPFISAFYAKFNGYNIKNLVKSTSSNKALSKDIKPIEASRWGVPNVMQVNQSSCFHGDDIKNFRAYKKSEKEIGISFDLSRNCMEGLRYRVALSFIGYIQENGIQKWQNLLDDNDKKMYFYSEVKKASDENIINEKIDITIPLEKLQSYYEGTMIKPVFEIETANTGKDYAQMFLKPYNNYINIPVKTTSLNEDIFERAFTLFNKGINQEALNLFDKALLLETLEAQEKVKTFFLQAILHVRLNEYKKANQKFDAFELILQQNPNIPTRKKEMAYLYALRCALYFSAKEYEKVLHVKKLASQKDYLSLHTSLLAFFAAKELNQTYNHPQSIIEMAVFENIENYLGGKIDWFTLRKNLQEDSYMLDPSQSYIPLSYFLLAMKEKSNNAIAQKAWRDLAILGYIDNPYTAIAKMKLGIVKSGN